MAANKLCTKKVSEVCGDGRESREPMEMGPGDGKRNVVAGLVKAEFLGSGISSIT